MKEKTASSGANYQEAFVAKSIITVKGKRKIDGIV